MFAECIRSLAFQGRLAIVGYVDGVLKGEIDLDAVHAKRLRIFGVSNKLRNAEQRAATARGFTADFLPAHRRRPHHAARRPGVSVRRAGGGEGLHGVRRATSARSC